MTDASMKSKIMPNQTTEMAIHHRISPISMFDTQWEFQKRSSAMNHSRMSDM